MRKISPSPQAGQVLLVILLVMTVGLTIGLSLATRSLTDIRVSTQIEESAQAFAAAEAGVEAALKGETPGTYAIGNATYTFYTTQAGQAGSAFSLGKTGLAETMTIWLTAHDEATGNLLVGEAYDYQGTYLDVCWGDSSETSKPALETTVVYQEGSNYLVERGAYDPDDSGRRTTNNFTDVDDGVNCGGNLLYGKRINLPAQVLIALRLRFFYAPTTASVAPQAGNSFSSQGVDIVSTGTVQGTSRKVVVTQSYPALPAVFDYVLFSGTGVNK